MNMITISLVRTAALAAALAAVSLPGVAGEAAAPTQDRALQIQELNGSISVSRVGSDIQVGSTRSAVALEIGHPSRILSDGSWMIYKEFFVDNSSAHGTLVVSFDGDRVRALRLVSPAVAVALATNREVTSHQIIVAAK